MIELNARPALRVELADGPVVMQLEQAEGRILAVWFLLNPEKLHGLDGLSSLR